jgi:type IV fimbrial biogenesis protein FimT
MISRGFSMVELMIAIAIVGFLLVMGIPSFTGYIQNSRLRSAAESCLAGLQRARAEAVRQNSDIQFILTDSAATAANVATAPPLATGRNWMIRSADLTTFIEGSPQSMQATVDGDGGGTAGITFNGLGRSDLTTTATIQFSNPIGGACAPTGPMRCLNIQVTVGGQIKMCDPAIASAGDTRRC